MFRRIYFSDSQIACAYRFREDYQDQARFDGYKSYLYDERYPARGQGWYLDIRV